MGYTTNVGVLMMTLNILWKIQNSLAPEKTLLANFNNENVEQNTQSRVGKRVVKHTVLSMRKSGKEAKAAPSMGSALHTLLSGSLYRGSISTSVKFCTIIISAISQKWSLLL